MGFKINAQLDLSDGFDEKSLLGNIQLTDGAHSIAEESVYLDSWLDALRAGLKAAIDSYSKSAIEIAEHPQPLLVHRDQTDAVHVTFRDNEVVAPSFNELKDAICSSIADFTNEVSRLSGKRYELPSFNGC